MARPRPEHQQDTSPQGTRGGDSALRLDLGCLVCPWGLHSAILMSYIFAPCHPFGQSIQKHNQKQLRSFREKLVVFDSCLIILAFPG